MEKNRTLVEQAYLDPGLLIDENVKNAVFGTIEGLDLGQLRVAQRSGDTWTTWEWVKKAILLYFKIKGFETFKAGDIAYYDKIPLKKWTGQESVRVVPGAIARYGSFIEKNCILMPSFINIGAHVGEGTMIDTWATVGSCAQIGKRVHLSGGVGIGGVLEPPQAQPVIIEDNAFIGSRCIIVEGVVVEEGAVLGAGVTLTQSTKIVDVTQKQPVIHQGRVPKNSVVIPGTLPKEFPAGTFGTPCALIIGHRKPTTDMKVGLNETLREFSIPV